MHETIEEALKLEMALARLRTPQKIAVLHYAPIQATVAGEPPEIIAFLGSSPARRAARPLSRATPSSTATRIAARSKGGRRANAPVYNVAMPLLAANFADRQPFRVIEVPVGEPAVGLSRNTIRACDTPHFRTD